MSIESETFANYLFRPEALMAYGFSPRDGKLAFVQSLPEDCLEIVLTYDGALSGRIMDLSMGEEYVSYRVTGATGYSAGIRQKFIDLLLDIREKCCRNQYFKSPQARRINEFIAAVLGGAPEFLWEKFPSYAAFRHGSSKKWYALIGAVPRYKLDTASKDRAIVEVINVKVDNMLIQDTLAREGYYPAFHMNKKSWASIILDDTLTDEEIQRRIKESYRVTAGSGEARPSAKQQKKSHQNSPVD